MQSKADSVWVRTQIVHFTVSLPSPIKDDFSLCRTCFEGFYSIKQEEKRREDEYCVEYKRRALVREVQLIDTVKSGREKRGENFFSLGFLFLVSWEQWKQLKTTMDVGRKGKIFVSVALSWDINSPCCGLHVYIPLKCICSTVETLSDGVWRWGLRKVIRSGG